MQSQGDEVWTHRPSADRPKATSLKKKWEATKHPNATFKPGKMRSDREEIPEGFTKADADKAEQLEARLAGGTDGAARMMLADGCQVYWPAPYEVCGRIRDKYNSLGGPNSFLLFPKTNELTNPDAVGKRTEFQNGPIYWSPQGDAHPVVNHFLAAWARHGYENSYIGYPTTDEIVNPDGIGRRQHFTGSTIYWCLNEAYSVGGAIAEKWYSIGAERPDRLLGYPISDELVLPDGQGRMNRFEHGVIYWHPTTGAHVVTGRILGIWSAAGFERSSYGYPTAEQTPGPDIRDVQLFQHGQIITPPAFPSKPHYQQYGGEKVAGPNYEIMLECLQRLRPNDEPLTAFPASGGQVLRCHNLQYIASKHFPDPYWINEADWSDFQECVAWTLLSSEEMNNVTQNGAFGRTRYNTYSDVRSFTIYDSNMNIVNAYTSGDGKDWGGCVKTWMDW